MIFITVGTHTQSFNRLLQKIDELIGKKLIREKIIAQIGNSNYKPKSYQYFKFADGEKILELNKKAKVVITHGGVGSIITALQFRKPVVVVPRLKKFNEHINDHQLQIAKAFEKQGKIIAVYDIDKLDKAIKQALKFKPKLKKIKPKIFEIVKNYLHALEKKK